MRLRRFAPPAIIALIIWAVLTIAPLVKPGFLPYFFDPKCITITIDANTERLDLEDATLEVTIQKPTLTIDVDTNLSIKASSSITIRSRNGPVLELTPGEKETLCYLGKETVEFSLIEVSARNASISILRSNNQRLINISTADIVEIAAYYDPKGDAIPVWLSDSATIEIASTGASFGMLYVTPQDPLKTQELFEVTELRRGKTGMNGFSFVVDAIQGNASFKELTARKVDGVVEADKDHVLEKQDTFAVRLCNPENHLHLLADKNDSSLRIIAQEIYGSLWINEVPHPESELEKLPRSAFASLFTVIVIVLTIKLEKHMVLDKEKSSGKSKRPESEIDIEYIEGVQAYLFFPQYTHRKDMNLGYHAANLRHGLIVNLKTDPPEAYFLTPESYGWQLMEKFPDRWISETIPFSKGASETDSFEFIEQWCEEKGYALKPWVAEKKDLL